MNRLVRVAATAALALHAAPAAAQQDFAPPPGFVIVPAPPPGYALEPVRVERSWVVGASAGTVLKQGRDTAPLDTTGTRFGLSADLLVRPTLSVGFFADRMSFTPASVGQGVGFTALGASVAGSFLGTPRSTHLRAGLGLSYERSSNAWFHERSSGLGARALLALVVPAGRQASVFLQGMIHVSPSTGEGLTYGPLLSLGAGVELGN